MVKQSLKIAISIYKPSTPRWLLSLQSKISVWLCGEKNPWIKPTTWERWFQNEHFISMQIEKDSVNLWVWWYDYESFSSRVWQGKKSSIWIQMTWSSMLYHMRCDEVSRGDNHQKIWHLSFFSFFSDHRHCTVICGLLPKWLRICPGRLTACNRVKSKVKNLWVLPCEEKQVKSGTCPLVPPCKLLGF